ncbi:MAG TPA: heme-binding domain-containing protein [Cyclobacteriaceae bacterium]|nr:heme-binding domain-containing protein [Cyclobacteriaceae bacterium]
MSWKLILVIIAVLLIVIQFINSKLPQTADAGSQDLFVTENVPDEVRALISRSCYDCHSMETKYPWYSYVAPVKWIIKHDINWGRGGVNFSDWGSLDDIDKVEKLGEISEVIEAREMPLKKYLILHPEARLTTDERQNIILWADSTAEKYFE